MKDSPDEELVLYLLCGVGVMAVVAILLWSLAKIGGLLFANALTSRQVVIGTTVAGLVYGFLTWRYERRHTR